MCVCMVCGVVCVCVGGVCVVCACVCVCVCVCVVCVCVCMVCGVVCVCVGGVVSKSSILVMTLYNTYIMYEIMFPLSLTAHTHQYM